MKLPKPFSPYMIATTIIKKYERAVNEQAKASQYFASLTEICPQELIPVWTRKIEEAEVTRQRDVTSMDYMKTTVKKRNDFLKLSYCRLMVDCSYDAP